MERLGLAARGRRHPGRSRATATPSLTSRIAIAGGGLERFATEVRNLQRTEVREVEEPFGAGQKGSSAMPHKRNPIRTERITGLARVLRGYAQAGLENIALWHERDISHSGAERVILPDATIGLDYMQHLATRVAEGMTVRTDRMRENLELTHGALFSQRALTALVESGMTRDDAYRVVQENAQRAWDSGTQFRELLGEAAPDLDLDAVFDYDAYLDPRARDLRAAGSASTAWARLRARWSSTPAGRRRRAGRSRIRARRPARRSTTAGYEYELKTVGGYRLMPWTWGSRERGPGRGKKLSGTNEVPILVLDDGEVISGSSTIARWAKEHPAARSAADAAKRRQLALARRVARGDDDRGAVLAARG